MSLRQRIVARFRHMFGAHTSAPSKKKARMTDRKINKIIIHCSATKPDMDIGAAKIKEWHTAAPPKGNGWSDVGYHEVITRSGDIEEGRSLGIAGAHTRGHNRDSIGICLVGGVDESGKPEDNFTDPQYRSLERLVRTYKSSFPTATVHGHNEFSNKACPSFDVQSWLRKVKII